MGLGATLFGGLIWPMLMANPKCEFAISVSFGDLRAQVPLCLGAE